MPTSVQAGFYSATLAYLNAVKATGTDDADKVMASMKATKWASQESSSWPNNPKAPNSHQTEQPSSEQPSTKQPAEGQAPATGEQPGAG